VSLVAGGGHDSTPAVVEAMVSAPERAGERVVVVEVANRSEGSLELTGSNRATLEQDLSGRPVKKARVRSKM
jgi:hypothetical protein